MLPAGVPPETETARADPANTADERATTAHRAKLAYV
jgi:hypothetical protein